MGFLAPIAMAVASVTSIIGSLKSAKKQDAPAPQPLPNAPKPEDAQAKAAEETRKRARRASITDQTRGSALVPETNVEQKSLLGA